MLALWALVLAAYSNSFQAGLVFDSAMAITGDTRIQAVTPRNLGLILTEGYWHGNTTSGLYRPLTTFSYLLNYAVFGNGTHPAGYHWVNLALHGVNVSLVYLLGLLVFGARRCRPWPWQRSGECIRCSPNPSPTLWAAPTCWPPSACWQACCVT